MTKEERDIARQIRASTAPARRFLMNVEREMRWLSPAQAGNLGRIIRQLEAWQERG